MTPPDFFIYLTFLTIYFQNVDNLERDIGIREDYIRNTYKRQTLRKFCTYGFSRIIDEMLLLSIYVLTLLLFHVYIFSQ